MDHATDHSPDHGHQHDAPADDAALTRTAISATLHCLTGCALGEITGLAVATALGWSDIASMAASISLAFLFGYALTTSLLVRSGLTVRQAFPLALASDTFSILTMEIVDTLIILIVPGAMAAGLGDALFWGSLAFALLVAFWAAVPVNRWLIARGRGHAVIHQHHHA